MNRYGENNSIDMPAMLRLGDNMFEDVNRDGKLTEEDFVYLGTDDPKISFSFNAGLEWNGFDVSVIFQGVGRRTVWRDGDNSSNVNWRVPMRSVYMNTTNQSVGNVWSPENPNAHYPTYTNGHNSIPLFLQAEQMVVYNPKLYSSNEDKNHLQQTRKNICSYSY